jgi:mono/diheme cytochrome c family protein
MIETFEGHNRFVVPTLLAAAVVPLALLLLVVGARSPYTHMNLAPGFDPNYTRTDQGVVGPPEMYHGDSLAVPPASDLVDLGHELFVAKGCASCHGLDGRGGIVGPPVAGTNARELKVKAQVGPGGMPAFAPGALSDEDLKAIAAYLAAMSK